MTNILGNEARKVDWSRVLSEWISEDEVLLV